MKSLNFTIDFEEEAKNVKIFHATPIKNNLYWYEDSPEKFYLIMAEKHQSEVMIYGHTHIQYFKQIGNKYFINAGSLGKPKDGDLKRCIAIVDINTDNLKAMFFRREYDI